jgi:hypothetical protein
MAQIRAGTDFLFLATVLMVYELPRVAAVLFWYSPLSQLEFSLFAYAHGRKNVSQFLSTCTGRVKWNKI